MSNTIRVLWITDDAHYKAWSFHVSKLLQVGVEVTHSVSSGLKAILHMCADKDFVIYHCGTVTTDARLREKLLAIKAEYPSIIIWLQSNAMHEYVRDVIDWTLYIGETYDTLKQVLLEQYSAKHPTPE